MFSRDSKGHIGFVSCPRCARARSWVREVRGGGGEREREEGPRVSVEGKGLREGERVWGCESATRGDRIPPHGLQEMG